MAIGPSNSKVRARIAGRQALANLAVPARADAQSDERLQRVAAARALRIWMRPEERGHGADDHVGVEDQRHAEVVDRRQRSDRPRAARRREIKGFAVREAGRNFEPAVAPIAAHVDLPMVNLLARDAVVRDVVWGTMSLLRFVQPVRSFGWQAGCRRLAGGRGETGRGMLPTSSIRPYYALSGSSCATQWMRTQRVACGHRCCRMGTGIAPIDCRDR